MTCILSRENGLRTCHGVAMYPGAAGFSGLKLWVFEFFPFSSWLALSTQRKGKQPEERKNNAKDNFEIEPQSISALDGIGARGD